MDSDIHTGFRRAGKFHALSIFPMTMVFAMIVIFPAASVARNNTTDSR